MRIAIALALLAACGGAAPAPVDDTENTGGKPAALTADASLSGPFARVEDVPDLQGSSGDPIEVRVLGSAAGPVTVALREVRVTSTAASCLATLETSAGFFVGPDFLCEAARSDETVFTEGVSVTIDGAEASIRFRTSYQLDQSTPSVTEWEIRCSLESPLSCTAPPAIGGYD